MPLYVGDYLADTGHLTTEEHGAYMLLLMHYWRHGSLSADPKQLASISRLSAGKWQKISPTIQRFFEIREDCWFHGRVMKELLESRRKYEKRVQAAKLGGIEKARKISAIRQGNSTAEAQQEHQNAPANHNHIKKEKVLTSSDAPSASRDIRGDLFSTGLRLLAEITGKTPDSCRSLLGKWLKLVEDEAIHVLAAIEDAHRNRIADPVPWISEQLRPRTPNGVRANGHKQHPTNRALQLADDMERALKRQADSAGDLAGGGEDAVGLLEWRRPA